MTNLETNNKLLAIIPARGGSQRLHRKNILKIDEKPLIAWTIIAAKQSNFIDLTILSSDDEEIIKVSKEWGCAVPFKRPSHLATSKSSSIDVVLHALDVLKNDFEYVILLQPTSPLRTSLDIDTAFSLMQSKAAPSCVSVYKTGKSPHPMYKISKNLNLKKITQNYNFNNEQTLSLNYALNGSIYIANINWLRKSKNFIGDKTIAYVMPEERSVDIDNKFDFQIFCEKVKQMNKLNTTDD